MIFHDTEGERRREREREGERGGGRIRKNKTEAGRWGVRSFNALPVNFDTFDNVGSVFRAYMLTAPAHSFPLAQSRSEISHSLSRNEALPCLAGELP